MTLPELLIFDMDGLLFDTERMFMNLKAGVLEKYGYVHREEDYIKTVGVSGVLVRAILEEIYGMDYPADTITKETRALQIDYIKKNGLACKPGIMDLLRWAEDKKIPCCVASSTGREYVELFLSSAGIRDFFSFLVCGDEVTRTKPEPEIFLLTCSKGKVAPSRALVLEDSENGVLAALNADIPVICIPDLKRPDESILSRAAAVFDNAADVITWLESL